MNDDFKTDDDWQNSNIENKYYLHRNMKYQKSIFDNNQIDLVKRDQSMLNAMSIKLLQTPRQTVKQSSKQESLS